MEQRSQELQLGRIDRTFGDGGYVRTRVTGEDRVRQVFALEDGRLLVVGMSGHLPHYRFAEGAGVRPPLPAGRDRRP